SVTATIQFNSRGLRNAPVKNTRHRWATMAARNTSAAQWSIWRMTSPARTSKLKWITDSYARDISMPRNCVYDPVYVVFWRLASKKNVRYVPVSTRITKQYKAISPNMNEKLSGKTLRST